MKRREHLSPDLTPLIDVIFLILIFFMVSSTFKKEELALLLTLPDTQSATEEIEKRQINIELTPEAVAYNGKEIDFDAMEKMLADVKDKTKPVNIRIDKAVRYARVMRLFDLLSKYGLDNLALESRQKRSNRP